MPFSIKLKPSGLLPQDLNIQKFHLLIVVLLRNCFSKSSCLAKVAKPYPVSGPTYLPQIPNRLHCTQKSAHQVLIS